MNSRELEFRHELSKMMRGVWEITWHEDGRVNPGVPDMSVVTYGPNPAGYETCWIELKAPTGKHDTPLGMEPSQIQWIDTHRTLVPILVLARFSGGIYWCDTRRDGSWKLTQPLEAWFRNSNFIADSVARTKLSDIVRNVSARRN